MVQTTGAGAGFRRKQNHGAVILPPMLNYYCGAKTLEEMTAQVAGRVLDQFGCAPDALARWEGMA